MSAIRRAAVLVAAVGAASACLVAPAYADFAVLSSSMSGANEVPGPGDPNATGSSRITLNSDTGRVCYIVRTTGLSAPPTAGHIHRGAAGTAGPVVIPFKTPRPSGIFAGCTTADKTLIQSIIDDPSGFYTNVHNAQFPGGAVRGQLHAVVVVRTPPHGPNPTAHRR